jgi:hypothetical protein
MNMAATQGSPAEAAVNWQKSFLNRAAPFQTDLLSE